jgi:site-specific recombinase XerD
LRGLVEQRYADPTVRQYLFGVAHFARWAHRRRLAIGDLVDDDIQRFLDQHLPSCTCPQPVHRSRKQLRAALRHLVASLEQAGVLTQCYAPDVVQDELHRFDVYMRDARGLAQNTRDQRRDILRPFLQQDCRSSRNELTLPTPDNLRQFIKQKLVRWSPASANVLSSTLRSYLRFREACGDKVGQLLPVIASPANWRLAPLPQTLSPTEVTRLLASFTPELPSALRAYAMVRCLVDLGLRASEVVNLGLDDIDWVGGTIRISQNKARRTDLLPLPQATGGAIAKYLRSERPITANRHVFVRHCAPVDVPIGAGVVQSVVRDAYLRCAMSHTRVHILRHTLASRLLNEGGTLKEVADVLRHRELNTSLIYAKVDANRLSAVAMPWPGSAA